MWTCWRFNFVWIYFVEFQTSLSYSLYHQVNWLIRPLFAVIYEKTWSLMCVCVFFRKIHRNIKRLKLKRTHMHVLYDRKFNIVNKYIIHCRIASHKSKDSILSLNVLATSIYYNHNCGFEVSASQTSPNRLIR